MAAFCFGRSRSLNSPRARAFQSRCQSHRKPESRHHVSGSLSLLVASGVIYLLDQAQRRTSNAHLTGHTSLKHNIPRYSNLRSNCAAAHVLFHSWPLGGLPEENERKQFSPVAEQTLAFRRVDSVWEVALNPRRLRAVTKKNWNDYMQRKAVKGPRDRTSSAARLSQWPAV